jgi:mannose-6-phosphate isomerase-like protein (cupin superfamily)
VALEERSWTNPRTGAWIKLSSAGDDTVLERVIKPHTGKADPHVHFDYAESFEIIDGTATVEVDGKAISAGPGERIELPPGTGHRNPYTRPRRICTSVIPRLQAGASSSRSSPRSAITWRTTR